MNIDELIDSVLRGVDNSWPTFYKIRYVYLEVGKILNRDTDFFFSVDGKLDEANLTIEQIKEIYESNTGRDYKVICKSASYILKMIYERLGIKAELIETNTTIATVGADDFLINHWLLVAYDGDKAYFMTLTPDLPYIKMGMETKHFASNIPYERSYNGKIFKVYKGEQIIPSSVSKEYLKKVDQDIGYIKEMYHYGDNGNISKEWNYHYTNASLFMLRDALKNNKLFYDLEICKTTFYKDLINFTGSKGQNISLYDCSLFQLDESDVNIWIKTLCTHVAEKISDLLRMNIDVVPPVENPNWNYNAWLFNLCVQMEDRLIKELSVDKDVDTKELKIDVLNFNYNKWSKKLKKKLSVSNDPYDYDNVLVLIDKLNALINCLNTKGKIGHLGEIFNSLAFHFIKPEHLYQYSTDDDGYLTNYYIANKFEVLFRQIFDCGNTIGEFNKMDYSEQIVIIKEILAMMFPEINYDNSKQLTDYNPEFSAILNRIQIYPIKNKKNGKYAIIFNIIGDYARGDYYFFYNPRTNEFNVTDALNIYNDYIVVSSRMKDRIESLENTLEDDWGIKK